MGKKYSKPDAVEPQSFGINFDKESARMKELRKKVGQSKGAMQLIFECFDGIVQVRFQVLSKRFYENILPEVIYEVPSISSELCYLHDEAVCKYSDYKIRGKMLTLGKALKFNNTFDLYSQTPVKIHGYTMDKILSMRVDLANGKKVHSTEYPALDHFDSETVRIDRPIKECILMFRQDEDWLHGLEIRFRDGTTGIIGKPFGSYPGRMAYT